jgi:hypothetical protein
MNGYILLANLVVALHLAYVAFVVVMVPVIVVGGILKWKWVRNFWFRLVHFLMMAVVVLETGFGVTCPMTLWERDLRIAGGQLIGEKDAQGNLVTDERGFTTVKQTDAYQEDFVGRLLRNILFFDPNEVPQHILNSFYYGFGALILITLFLIPPRWPWRRERPPSDAGSQATPAAA